MYFWSTSMTRSLLWPWKWLSIKPDSLFDMIFLCCFNATSFSPQWFLGVKNVFLSQMFDLASLIFQKACFLCICFALHVLCQLNLKDVLMLLYFYHWLLWVIWWFWFHRSNTVFLMYLYDFMSVACSWVYPLVIWSSSFLLTVTPFFSF